jgi:hypothetical protein
MYGLALIVMEVAVKMEDVQIVMMFTTLEGMDLGVVLIAKAVVAAAG